MNNSPVLQLNVTYTMRRNDPTQAMRRFTSITSHLPHAHLVSGTVADNSAEDFRFTPLWAR